MTDSSASPRASRLGIGRRQSRDFWSGTKAIAPLIPGSVIFGLAFGALIPAAGIDLWVGPFASATVVAGASQFAIIEQLGADAPAAIAIFTALVINARFALYSTALAPVFQAFPRRWRYGLAHVMTDQAAVTILHHTDAWPDPVRRRWFALGAGLPFATTWVLGTVAGVLLGPVLPAAWQIGFIVPLMFISVLFPHLRTRPALVAAVVAVAVVVIARDLPYGLNVLLGALAGIGLGTIVPEPATPTPVEDAVGT